MTQNIDNGTTGQNPTGNLFSGGMNPETDSSVGTMYQTIDEALDDNITLEDVKTADGVHTDEIVSHNTKSEETTQQLEDSLNPENKHNPVDIGLVVQQSNDDQVAEFKDQVNAKISYHEANQYSGWKKIAKVFGYKAQTMSDEQALDLVIDDVLSFSSKKTSEYRKRTKDYKISLDNLTKDLKEKKKGSKKSVDHLRSLRNTLGEYETQYNSTLEARNINDKELQKDNYDSSLNSIVAMQDQKLEQYNDFIEDIKDQMDRTAEVALEYKTEIGLLKTETEKAKIHYTKSRDTYNTTKVRTLKLSNIQKNRERQTSIIQDYIQDAKDQEHLENGDKLSSMSDILLNQIFTYGENNSNNSGALNNSIPAAMKTYQSKQDAKRHDLIEDLLAENTYRPI